MHDANFYKKNQLEHFPNVNTPAEYLKHRKCNKSGLLDGYRRQADSVLLNINNTSMSLQSVATILILIIPKY